MSDSPDPQSPPLTLGGSKPPPGRNAVPVLVLSVFVWGGLITYGVSNRNSLQPSPASPAPRAVPPSGVAPVPADEARAESFLEDTRAALRDADEALREIANVVDEGLASAARLDSPAWRGRLDDALLALSDSGYRLVQPPPALVAAGEDDTGLPPSVAKVREEREALGNAMVEYTNGVRGAMPLLTEEPQVAADPGKFRSATKDLSKLTRLHADLLREAEAPDAPTGPARLIDRNTLAE